MLLRTLAAAALALTVAACGPSKEAKANLAAADAFMAENAKKEGVKTLPSGLQYKVVRSGPETGARPGPKDEVKVHYEGKLLDGTVFDSSYERGVPATFPLDGLIPAWKEAIPMMRPGDEWTLYVPPSLGYGAQDKGPIPANSVMVFRIELLGSLPSAGGSARG